MGGFAAVSIPPSTEDEGSLLGSNVSYWMLGLPKLTSIAYGMQVAWLLAGERAKRANSKAPSVTL